MQDQSIITPWVASWSEEASFEVRPCRWAAGRLAVWSPFKPGRGRPHLSRPHPVRQRRAIAEMRCSICGEKTGKGYHDRWWFGLGQCDAGGFGFTTTEAPLHFECAQAAKALCPHVSALGLDPEPMPQWDAVISAIVGGEAMVRDYGIDVGHREVIGHMKLAWRRRPPMLRKGL